MKVEEEFQHPGYDTDADLRSNDIGLLKLAEEIDLNVYTPACLPPSGRDFTGRTGSVYGENQFYHKVQSSSVIF